MNTESSPSSGIAEEPPNAERSPGLYYGNRTETTLYGRPMPGGTPGVPRSEETPGRGVSVASTTILCPVCSSPMPEGVDFRAARTRVHAHALARVREAFAWVIVVVAMML